MQITTFPNKDKCIDWIDYEERVECEETNQTASDGYACRKQSKIEIENKSYHNRYSRDCRLS